MRRTSWEGVLGTSVGVIASGLRDTRSSSSGRTESANYTRERRFAAVDAFFESLLQCHNATAFSEQPCNICS